MRGAFRIDSKEIRASKEMTYIKYIIIYVDIFSLTNKVEEHCAFPSLLSLICGYLRCARDAKVTQNDSNLILIEQNFEGEK